MTENVMLKLADGSEREVSSELVEAVALGLPEGDSTQTEVEVGGRRVEALRLLESALHLQSDMIRLHQAKRALEELGYRTVSEEPRLTTRVAAPTGASLPAPVEADADLPDLTPSLVASLQRERGRWVGVHRGELLATGGTLRELMSALDDREASVLFVPPGEAPIDFGL